jgi:hypothetical protein
MPKHAQLCAGQGALSFSKMKNQKQITKLCVIKEIFKCQSNIEGLASSI